MATPPEPAVAPKDAGGEEESEGSSTERNKHMVQQWLLNQSDSFHSVENPSVSDRRDSTKSGSGMGPTRNQERPTMGRISEKRIPNADEFDTAVHPERRGMDNGSARGFDADARGSRGSRGARGDPEPAYATTRGRENGAREDPRQMPMSRAYKEAFEADAPEPAREPPPRESPVREIRGRDARSPAPSPRQEDDIAM